MFNDFLNNPELVKTFPEFFEFHQIEIPKDNDDIDRGLRPIAMQESALNILNRIVLGMIKKPLQD